MYTPPTPPPSPPFELCVPCAGGLVEREGPSISAFPFVTISSLQSSYRWPRVMILSPGAWDSRNPAGGARAASNRACT